MEYLVREFKKSKLPGIYKGYILSDLSGIYDPVKIYLWFCASSHVFPIPWKAWREFLYIWHKRPLGLKDELTKHVFGLDSRIHTLML